jgi:hypothetical protein
MTALSQNTIGKLVTEASSENCTEKRRTEIRIELLNSIPRPGSQSPKIKYEELSTEASTVSRLVRSVFTETSENEPEKLIGLIPFFKAACSGDNPGKPVKIEWVS